MTFKLALIQAGLFAASATLLFVAVYLGVIRYATAQIKASIHAELAVLAEEAASDGLADLVASIDLRSADRESEGRAYLLQAGDGRRLAGLLPVGFAAGWRTIRPPVETESTTATVVMHDRLVLGQVLPDGSRLMVARSMKDVDEVSRRIVQVFGWAAGVTLILAMLSGMLTSLAALRRVESINATAQRIMQGDLAQRVLVRGTQDEFDRLATNLNAMLDRIQDLMEGLRQVSADIAHDLRTPLAHLRQRLESARVGEPSIEAYETAIDAMVADTDRIMKMFAALLRIAQIEAGTRRGGFSEVDLSGTFLAILDIYGPVAEDAGQRLTGTIESGIRIRGDRELLMQMLANLVENAIRYAGNDADIRVDLRADGGVALGSVSDTGPGVPLEAREKVWRRFYRLAPDRGLDGHGLGLSLVKAVADLHDAQVTLSDNGPGLHVGFSMVRI